VAQAKFSRLNPLRLRIDVATPIQVWEIGLALICPERSERMSSVQRQTPGPPGGFMSIQATTPPAAQRSLLPSRDNHTHSRHSVAQCGRAATTRQAIGRFAERHSALYPLLGIGGNALRQAFGVPNGPSFLPAASPYVIDGRGWCDTLFQQTCSTGPPMPVEASPPCSCWRA